MTDKAEKYTEKQAQAVQLRGKNLLVAAAAGSGKTFTLIERILSLLSEGRCRIDELLVATFTNAAAAEMRTRIEKKLTAGAEHDPKMAAQLVRLPGASISTLHAFCQALVRQNFAALDIDPRFRLGSEQEMTLLQDRVMADLFEASYEQGGEDFETFVRQYGQDRSDETLHEIVLRLYKLSRSQEDPEGWLTGLITDFAPAADASLADQPWYAEVRQEARRALEGIQAVLSWMTEMASSHDCDAYIPTFEAHADQIEACLTLLDTGSHDELCQAAADLEAVNSQKIGRAPDADPADRKFLQNMRDKDVKKKVTALRKRFFSSTEEDIRRTLEETAPAMRAVTGLVRRFSEAFQKAKKKKSVLDFNDLEHFTLRLLRDEELARTLRARYYELMVDEYQDTNGVQEAILRRLSNGSNLFAVGDIKQSIYRFRLADPNLFRQKQEAYSTGSAPGQLVTLSDNYRSRPNILAAVNFLFTQVMVAPEMETGYGPEEALYAKGDFPEPPGLSFDQSPVEVVLLEQDDSGTPREAAEADPEGEDAEALSGFPAEAAWIARRLRDLYDSQVQVFDKDSGGYRRIRWRDMAVLMRAVTAKAPLLLDAFRALDIPAYATVDAGYFQEIEIQRMLALLEVIDNARREIPLAAVLHSPIGRMTARELAEMRAAFPEEDFCTAFQRSDNPRAVRFRDQLTGWRRLARRAGVPELLWQLYRDTGYYDYVGAEPGGRLRQANLRMLCDRAADYEKTNLRGLFRFLQFIRRMRDRDTDLAIARTLGENEDVVRVMTIHKSKGLEFPVVVLADTGKRFNDMDTNDTLLAHRDLGLGPYCVETDGPLSWKYPTLRREATAARIRRENRAEELRLLYVAMTRAREKLILTGRVKKLPQQAAKWCRHNSRREVALPGWAAASAVSYLDWLGPALSRDGNGGRELRDIAGLEEPPAIDYDESLLGTPHWQLKILPPPSAAPAAADEAKDEWLDHIRALEPLPSPDDAAQADRLNWRYPWKTDTPAKLTVTEWKHRQAAALREEMESGPAAGLLPGLPEENAFAPPAFLSEPVPDAPLGGTAYGTLMHSILQRIDLRGDCTKPGIQDQIAAFSAAGFLSDQERSAVRVGDLAAFFTSSLGQRLQKAAQVWREQPFSLLLPALRIDEAAAPEDEIFLQGVIDVFFEESDGRIVLVDYKTDRHTTPDTIRQRYQLQLSLYAEAIRRLTGKTVCESYIYRLFDRDAIAMPL